MREVAYVDANGDLQTINDPRELLAAAGCFGLLGVVVSLTLELDKMGITEMMPVTLPLLLTIPPPSGYEIPSQLQKAFKAITKEELHKALQDFINRCEHDYYLEWF